MYVLTIEVVVRGLTWSDLPAGAPVYLGSGTTVRSAPIPWVGVWTEWM